MTATTLEAPAHPATSRSASPIPFSRIARVELRKMFDTRAGFWMLMSIGITSVLATAAAIAFAPDAMLTYETFGSAVGMPMSVILPMIAVLSVTSEYTQRTGLTTYTLVPHRSRVIAAKALMAILVGVVSMGVALAVGAVGNLLAAAINGVDAIWGVTATDVGHIVLANVLGMMVGFMLGVLFRSSAAAIVGYFVYSLVLPAAFGALAAFQEWFRDLQPWIDFNYASVRLFDSAMTGEHWAQLGVSGLIWLVAPLSLGLWLVIRSEVK